MCRRSCALLASSWELRSAARTAGCALAAGIASSAPGTPPAAFQHNLNSKLVMCDHSVLLRSWPQGAVRLDTEAGLDEAFQRKLCSHLALHDLVQHLHFVETADMSWLVGRNFLRIQTRPHGPWPGALPGHSLAASMRGLACSTSIDQSKDKQVTERQQLFLSLSFILSVSGPQPCLYLGLTSGEEVPLGRCVGQ